MAVITSRINLAAATFPFAVELWGRSIMVNQYDFNYDKAALNIASSTTPIDKGIPQSFFLQNVLPSTHGYQAIGYSKVILGAVDAGMSFDNIYQITNVDGNRFLYSPASGNNFVFDAPVGSWQKIDPFIPGVIGDFTQVTTAYVHGETYIFIQGVGCRVYNAGTKAFDDIVLTGLSISDILGITSANGYMIAWTDTAVAWSSLVDPTDFTPDITTGAGGSSVNDVRGTIVACLALAGGFIVYASENSVGARYSGNINFPFIMKEIAGSAGVRDITKIAWHTNMAYHYAWTAVGLLKMELQAATQVFTEFSDFIAGKQMDDFDYNTATFSQEYLAAEVFTKFSVIDNRYLVLSYGKSYPELTHALVYDMNLSRWGRLKINHRCCFEFNFPNLYGALTYGDLINTTYFDLLTVTYGDLLTRTNPQIPYKKAFAFLQSDGSVYVADFAFAENNDSIQGVLAVGKFQIARTLRLNHQSADVETIGENNFFKYYITPTYDGKTFRPAVEGFLMPNQPGVVNAQTRTYKRIVGGLSFASLFIGRFNLVSCVITMNPTGHDT